MSLDHDPASDKFACPICNRQFGRKYNLEKHLATHRPGYDYPCRVCCSSFTSESLLMDHIKSHNGVKYNEVQFEVACSICPQTFPSQFQMHEHIQDKHLETRGVVCEVCLRKFPTLAIKKMHEKKHRLSYICDQCESSFATETAFAYHMKQHEKVQEFKCEYCLASFRFSSNLRQHQLKHTQKRSYTCEHCNKQFYRPETLRDHQNAIHLGIKPFKCQEHGCVKAFTQRSALKKHVTNLHSKCTTCGFIGSKMHKCAS